MKKETKSSPGLFKTAVVAIAGGGAGMLTAWRNITNYAKENFERLGYFKALEDQVAAQVKDATSASLADSVKRSNHGEYGWSIEGVLGEVQEKYDAGVRQIFKEKGAPGLVDKWKNVLTKSQKKRTAFYTAGIAIAIGAFVHWGLRPRNDKESTTIDR